MDLEYINIIQESCEEMADIFDYDNNYTLARPYLQEAEEQKEGLIKRGIGAIIRFVQKIYGWFKEKVELVIDTIRKKLFNNNKVVAAAAEKQLEKEEAKASSQPASKPAQPTAKSEPKQAEPVAQVKQLSDERKAIFDVIRKIINALKSDKPGYIYNAGYGPYRNKFSEEEKSMDTYDLSFGTDDGFGLLKRVTNLVSDIEFKVEEVLSDTRGLDKSSAPTKESQNTFMQQVFKRHFDRGAKSLLIKPLEKIKDDCFAVLSRTSAMCMEKDNILKQYSTNDLNELSRMLNKGLKKNKVHDKDILKLAHDYLLKAFQIKQTVFDKVTTIFNVAAQSYTMSAKKCIGLLFQLSRKA